MSEFSEVRVCVCGHSYRSHIDGKGRCVGLHTITDASNERDGFTETCDCDAYKQDGGRERRLYDEMMGRKSGG